MPKNSAPAPSEPLTKRVREALGMSQRAFGKAIGRSFQSVRLYDAENVPSYQVLSVIASLCSGARLTELHAEVLAAIQKRQEPKPVPVFLVEPHEVVKAHGLLDGILRNSDPETVRAVLRFLTITWDWTLRCIIKPIPGIKNYPKDHEDSDRS